MGATIPPDLSNRGDEEELVKRLAAVTVALFAAGALAISAGAVNSNAKQKGPLFAGAIPFCNLGFYFAQGVESQHSKFSMSFRDRPDLIRARVVLRNATPFKTYYVRLIQGFGDCLHNDVAFTTNFRGRGSVSFQEPATSVASVLFVCDSPVCFLFGHDFYASKPVFLHEGPGLRPLSNEGGSSTPVLSN